MNLLNYFELLIRRRIHLFALRLSDNYDNATADFLCAGDLIGCRKTSELNALREAQTFFLKQIKDEEINK